MLPEESAAWEKLQSGFLEHLTQFLIDWLSGELLTVEPDENVNLREYLEGLIQELRLGRLANWEGGVGE